MYILKLKPVFKNYIWGGTKLRDEYGFESDLDKLAEGWMLSCHKDGENTRKADLSGDKKKLLEIAEKDYTTAMERIKNFHKVYQKWWMSENKPHGFDMQDIRIGGALQRLESCKERIISYCKGELDSIPELEEQRLEGNTHTTWARTITPNVISHVV